uniref:NADH dehydrogenase subunit 6 n=1 Tax=Anastatus dexingensis TaxID=2926466 RepID=A0A9E8YH01_9HYME|nr:NADH dehydrogenase subunit 6 [Anastatus dexingensis]WAJ57471.1 NADH dehydrogenase subunit 6 [Anastatus dexingensis]
MHPMNNGMILLFLTIFSSMWMNLFFNNHWMSFIIFLIMIGGLMILFLYFTSFISNMNSLIKWKNLSNFFIKILLLMTTLFMIIQFKNEWTWTNSFNEINSINKLMININFENNIQMNFLFMINKNFNTILLMIFLIICLTLIVKICINKKLSLRKINYEKIYLKK